MDSGPGNQADPERAAESRSAQAFDREPSVVRTPVPGGHKSKMRLGPVRLAIIAAVLIPSAVLVFSLVSPGWNALVYAVICATTVGIAMAVDPDRVS